MAKTIRAKTMEVASSHVAVLARLEETAKKIDLGSGGLVPGHVRLSSKRIDAG
jgi:hypothetical protein